MRGRRLDQDDKTSTSAARVEAISPVGGGFSECTGSPASLIAVDPYFIRSAPPSQATYRNLMSQASDYSRWSQQQIQGIVNRVDDQIRGEKCLHCQSFRPDHGDGERCFFEHADVVSAVANCHDISHSQISHEDRFLLRFGLTGSQVGEWQPKLGSNRFEPAQSVRADQFDLEERMQPFQPFSQAREENAIPSKRSIDVEHQMLQAEVAESRNTDVEHASFLLLHECLALFLILPSHLSFCG